MTHRPVTTGAVASSSRLFVATIGPDGGDRMRLIKSRSGEVRLVGRDQVSLQTFASFLLDFLEHRRIDQLVLVSAPENGSHMAAASTYKIEAVLQLMPIKVSLFSSISLSNKRLPADANIPGPDRERLSASDANLQSRAITAAVHWIADRTQARLKAIEQERLTLIAQAAASHEPAFKPQDVQAEGGWQNSAGGRRRPTRGDDLFPEETHLERMRVLMERMCNAER